MRSRETIHRIYRRKARLRDFILLLLFSPLNSFCCFCRKPFTEEDFPNKTEDNVTIHHVDENRENDHPSNKRLAHKICHKRYHFNKDKVWKHRKTNGVVNG